MLAPHLDLYLHVMQRNKLRIKTIVTTIGRKCYVHAILAARASHGTANHVLLSDQNLVTMYFGSPNLGLHSQSLKGWQWVCAYVAGIETSTSPANKFRMLGIRHVYKVISPPHNE